LQMLCPNGYVCEACGVWNHSSLNCGCDHMSKITGKPTITGAGKCYLCDSTVNRGGKP
jgi:hypothetical protein